MPGVVALCICMATLAPRALGGGVVKIDESAINGEVVSFDGNLVTVQTGMTNGMPQRQALPLAELLRVRIAGGPATIVAAPSNAQVSVSATVPPVNVPTGTRAAVAGQRVAAQPVARSRRSVVPPLPPPQSPQPIVLPPTWQLRSSAGDQIEGRLRAWTQEQVSFEFAAARTPFDVPTGKVLELWRAAPDLVRRARELKADSPDEDVAYVIREDEIVPVKGVALGIDSDSLKFRYSGEERKISMQRLLGVVLVSQKMGSDNDSPMRKFHQSFMLGTGTLQGRWRKLESDIITIETLMGPLLQLPASAVTVIENRNGRVVYLSDLTPAKVEQTPYFDRMMHYRNDTGLSGGPLRLSDSESQRGVAVHSRTVLEYDLGGRFERFQSRVGFEHTFGTMGRAAIRVVADGKSLFENPDLRGDQKPADLNLDVEGVKRLTLEVDFGADEDVGDRVIWAGARLVRREVER